MQWRKLALARPGGAGRAGSLTHGDGPPRVAILVAMHDVHLHVLAQAELLKYGGLRGRRERRGWAEGARRNAPSAAALGEVAA